MEQLVLLVNPENELDHIGATGPVSPSCMEMPGMA